MSCTCETYAVPLPNGETLSGVKWLDPDCRKHGLPEPIKGGNNPTDEDYWPARHPLRCHAGLVRIQRQQPRWVRSEGYGIETVEAYRLERPREVEARLLREAQLGIPIPPLRKLPPFRECPTRFGQR